jgi:hypothetical protein
MAITPSLCPRARLSPNNSDSNGCAIQKAKCDVRIFQEIQNLLVVGKGKLVSGGVLKQIRGSTKRDTPYVELARRYAETRDDKEIVEELYELARELGS